MARGRKRRQSGTRASKCMLHVRANRQFERVDDESRGSPLTSPAQPAGLQPPPIAAAAATVGTRTAVADQAQDRRSARGSGSGLATVVLRACAAMTGSWTGARVMTRGPMAIAAPLVPPLRARVVMVPSSRRRKRGADKSTKHVEVLDTQGVSHRKIRPTPRCWCRRGGCLHECRGQPTLSLLLLWRIPPSSCARARIPDLPQAQAATAVSLPLSPPRRYRRWQRRCCRSMPVFGMTWWWRRAKPPLEGGDRSARSLDFWA
jgi:hypothetical protein